MGTNRDIKSDGNINITSTQTNISGDLDVTGSINNFNFPASDGINGQALVTNGSGTLSFADAGAGGAGGINYITNTRATADTTGYATYADAAATTPADGTGGSANITFTRNTTTPLRDGGDFKIAKDAVNRQGEGVGYAFTIDSADKARKLIISFDYDASHASYADDDIKIFIYDVTNTNLIRVNGEDLKGGKGKHYAQFQTASNSTSYRLIFHVSSTNASAYNVFLDEISVGPQTISHGAGGNDVAFRATLASDSATESDTDMAQVPFDTVTFDTHGNWNNSTYKYMIPETGYYQVSINIRFKNITNGDYCYPMVETSASDTPIAGIEYVSAGGAAQVAASDVAYLTKGTEVWVRARVGADTSWALDGSSAGYSYFSIQKIASSQASEDLGGRDVAMTLEGLNSGDQALSNATGTKVVNWGAAASDTHGAWDSGNSKYVIPVTGYYQINFGSHVTDEASTVGLTSVTAHIYIDGSPKQRKTERQPAASNCESQVSALMYLTKDQYVEFYTRYDGDGNVDASNDVFNGSQYTFASIHKVASPQTILENETVAFIADTNAGQSMANASSTIVDFEDVEHDSHNAYNAGTYTIPVTGLYKINSSVMLESTSAIDIGEVMYVSIKINGSSKRIQNYREGDVSDSDNKHYSMQISALLSLNKGDEVTIQVYQGSGGSLDLFNSSQYNSLDIHKIK